ncbi:cytochrome P450 2U1-like [Anneissia japonica]|uniref:cytochrome P450 2U1-like n=1 Tax=Anneissia japonica TaxID=1529436 RepID=UPI001425962A|nr:cytochrome P450 2U1-like [Anneissia japonica]
MDSLNFVGSVGNYSTLIIFVIVFLLLFLRQRSIDLFPPGPPPLPVVGNLFSYGEIPFQAISKWAEKYGKIFTLYHGPFRKSIWINDLALAKELFIGKSEIFSERKMVPFLAHTSGVEGSVVWENGPAWKTRRKWMMSALRHFGMGKRSIETKLNVEADMLCHEAAKYQSQPFNPQHIINCSVANVICSLCFGERYDYSDPEFVSLLDNLMKYFRQTNLQNIETHMPFLIDLPMFRYKKLAVTQIQEFIQRRIAEHQSSFQPNVNRDLIDLLLLEVEKSRENEDGYFQPDTMWSTIFAIFVAGAETTSSSLSWFILYMARFPKIQSKVHEEIDRVLEGRRPTMADKSLLPYFEASIYESQRLGNTAPTTLPHSNNEDFYLEGYKIPKGTTISINQHRMHTSPRYWNEPTEFNPSRFLTNDGQKVKKPESFMPFGIGRRACPGESLAKSEMFVFMTNFMQRFKVVMPDDQNPPCLDPHVGITLIPKPYQICTIPRM